MKERNRNKWCRDCARGGDEFGTCLGCVRQGVEGKVKYVYFQNFVPKGCFRPVMEKEYRGEV